MESTDTYRPRSPDAARSRRLRCRLLGVAVASFVALATASVASARPSDPFTPSLTFSSSTYKAGEHPDLAIEIGKPPNQCPPGPSRCGHDEIYFEQDLKRISASFPASFLADPNAAPSCDPYPAWVRAAGKEHLWWFCRDRAAEVGTADIVFNTCARYPGDPEDPSDPGEAYCLLDNHNLGRVFNNAPRRDASGRYLEQGNLTILWPDISVGAWLKTDVSIRVRKPDLSIEAVADPLPDIIPDITRPIGGGDVEDDSKPGQIERIDLHLNGSKGASSGHPFFTNAALCAPGQVEFAFEGYARNSGEGLGFNFDTGDYIFYPGEGSGKVVGASAPYQVTDCDVAPYDPSISLDFDTTAARAAPAISATVRQDPEGATTDEVVTRLPRGFQVNTASTAAHCRPEQLAEEESSPADEWDRGCPESARIGKLRIWSPQLPASEGGTIDGNIYLAGLSGEAVRIAAFLKGFIDLRIDAEGSVDEAGQLKTTFRGLPVAKLSRVDLQLEGGPKGLFRNSSICGTDRIVTDFKSHSGKVKTSSTPVTIQGCSPPTFDAELSSKKPGARTDLNVSLSPSLTPVTLASVEFQLARYLHWREEGKARKAATSLSAGSITFNTTSRDLTVPISARRSRNGNVTFTPLRRAGRPVVRDLAGFSAKLIRTRRRQPALTGRGIDRRTGRRVARQTDLVILSGMPSAGLTGIELNLKGTGRRQSFGLTNPTGCKRELNFVARATTTDGHKIALGDRVKLRCKRG